MAIIYLVTLGGCTSVYDKARECATEITARGNCETPASDVADANLQTPVAPSPVAPAATPQNASAAVESRVYLDASESMRGFAAPGENNQFVKLLETIGYALPGCRLFKYGISTRAGSRAEASDVNKIENNLSEIRFSKDLGNESFYNLGNNPDDVLFNHLANEEKPVRSVLITDGVYSSPNAELQSETVKAIENWMRRGRFFGILIFRSPFAGKLWSENKRVWIEDVNVDKRPFYAFVFSPDEKGFIELRDKLAAEFSNLDAVTFPKEAVHCELSPKTKISLEDSEEPPNSPFYLYQYTSDIFNENNSAELFYDLGCKPAESYPIEKFAVQISLNYYSWEGSAFKKNDKPPLSSIEYAPLTGGAADEKETKSAPAPNPPQETADKGNLKISLHKEPKTAYSFYHLIFNLSGNNNVLQKIRGLSTQDDSVRENADRTYRFYEFISALATVHLQNKEAIKLPPPTFVLLTN